ncbi:MAG: hypothetical protein QM820_24640 [Minicystis sp.]
MRQNLRVTADGRFVPDDSGQRRVIRLGHILGPPASAATLSTWLERWPRHPLPTDLKTLVARLNGIHLWAYLDTGRSPQGIAPLEEWNLARVKMYGEGSSHPLLTDQYLAISYDENGASFVVLDVDSGVYYLMDSAGPDTTSPLGSTVDDLLDWVWTHRIGPSTYSASRSAGT